jgi:hypothetical protein
MLFPDEPVRTITKRDAWLINRYPPNNILKHVPASLLPGGVTYVAGMLSNPVPNALIAEVDRAHFRLSLRNEVYEWFERRGFDLTRRTIPKHLFEAAVQAEFGQLPAEPVKSVDKGAAKAKPRKPTAPSEESGETYSAQLVSLMQEIGLAKSGLRLSEVRIKVEQLFKKKYPKRARPDDITFNRAYKKYKNAKDTRAE